MSYRSQSRGQYELRSHYHPLLAGYDIHGKPWVNPEVAKRLGKSPFPFADNILKHQTVFLEEIRKPGVSWTEARQAALEAEHRGMSREKILTYEGQLGALENDLKRNPPIVDPIGLAVEDEREAGPYYRRLADVFEKKGEKEVAAQLRSIAAQEDKHKTILTEIAKQEGRRLDKRLEARRLVLG